MTYIIRNSDYLAHHGIVGMHWGIRRYQNNDGTLTEAGKARYGTTQGAKDIRKALTSMDKESANVQYDYKVNEIKRQKLTDKANKAREKGKDEKANEYESRAKEYEKNRDSAEKKAKDIDNKINSVINKALKDGYNVEMQAIARKPSTLKGKEVALTLAGSAAIVFTPMSVLYPVAGSVLAGNVGHAIGSHAYFKNRGQGSYLSEGFRYKVNPGSGTLTQKGQNAHW